MTDLASILALPYAGNHHSDSASMRTVDRFVNDPGNPVPDRARALRDMVERGMGVPGSVDQGSMTDDEYVAAYVSCCS